MMNQDRICEQAVLSVLNTRHAERASGEVSVSSWNGSDCGRKQNKISEVGFMISGSYFPRVLGVYSSTSFILGGLNP